MPRGSVYECDLIPLGGRVAISAVAVFRDRAIVGFEDGSLRSGVLGTRPSMHAPRAPARPTLGLSP
jgi:hypothetical protein